MSKFAQELSKHRKANVKEGIKDFLDEESYQDFVEALKNPNVSAPTIVLALNSFGVEVSETTVRRWRSKEINNV